MPTTGCTIWLTGLPSAGKSTLARSLAGVLVDKGHRVEVLDGDECRVRLCAELGFSAADRNTNVGRIGFVANLLARNDVIAVVSVIAPYAAARTAVRAEHEAAGVPFLEVYVATSLPVCVQRDVKGLYALQAAGRLTGLTGVDDPYEAPESPELRVDTEQDSVDETTALLVAELGRRGLL